MTPEARGTGIGGAAGREPRWPRAGATTAWVIADDDGLARALYERLGFETVWLQHAFVRQP